MSKLSNIKSPNSKNGIALSPVKSTKELIQQLKLIKNTVNKSKNKKFGQNISENANKLLQSIINKYKNSNNLSKQNFNKYLSTKKIKIIDEIMNFTYEFYNLFNENLKNCENTSPNNKSSFITICLEYIHDKNIDLYNNFHNFNINIEKLLNYIYDIHINKRYDIYNDNSNTSHIDLIALRVKMLLDSYSIVKQSNKKLLEYKNKHSNNFNNKNNYKFISFIYNNIENFTKYNTLILNLKITPTEKKL